MSLRLTDDILSSSTVCFKQHILNCHDKRTFPDLRRYVLEFIKLTPLSSKIETEENLTEITRIFGSKDGSLGYQKINSEL